MLNGNAIESEALLKLRDRAYESGTVEESETMIKLKRHYTEFSSLGVAKMLRVCGYHP